MSDEEKDWVAGLRRADGASFDAVYDKYRRRVYGFIVRLVGNRSVAEDLMQETFLRLARRARELEPDTRLRPWLFTVARNLVVDYRRRSLLDIDKLRDLALWPTKRSTPQTPLEQHELGEDARRLESELRKLPTKYREAVLLVCVEGLDPQDAATVVGVKPEALRQRLSRGRKLLREALLPSREEAIA